MERREFLKIAGTTLGGLLMAPKFLTAIPKITVSGEDILVVIQLNGGNDGLNTFIPYGDAGYYQYRNRLAIPKTEVLSVNSNSGFHPALKGFAEMMQAGNISVVQNVGYPNADRSHFRSIEIWNTASKTEEYLSTGWLGRWLDNTCAETETLAGVCIDNNQNLALKGQENHSIAMQNPEKFNRQMKTAQLSEEPVDPHEHPNISYLKKVALSAFEGADDIQKALEKSKLSNTYPKSGLGQYLYWISRMIQGGLPTKVYYTSMSGFDTHANQLSQHTRLFKELSEAVTYFHNDLKTNGLLSKVTVLIFSEFGRRVAENGSGGTDHGKAAPVFIIGGNNKGGIINSSPNFSLLDEGDVRFDTDFKSIYSTILKQKFKADLTQLGLQSYTPLSLFKS